MSQLGFQWALLCNRGYYFNLYFVSVFCFCILFLYFWFLYDRRWALSQMSQLGCQWALLLCARGFDFHLNFGIQTFHFEKLVCKTGALSQMSQATSGRCYCVRSLVGGGKVPPCIVTQTLLKVKSFKPYLMPILVIGDFKLNFLL